LNVTLDYLKSNRKWLIRDFRVWGDNGAVDADMLVSETDSPSSRVVYMREFAGGLTQIVNFADLIDHRGNNLPTSIANAAVIPIPKNPVSSFVCGVIAPGSFRIAKDRSESDEAVADLLIMELN